jgi:L-threonylcarbamoyladenylate synthase
MTERLASDESGIEHAVQLLRAGQLVAVPTETVYGLAARADSEDAVAEIYRAKGRPSFNPLISHVASVEMARRLAQFDNRAERLAAHFWPGPLTLVLPLREGSGVVPAVTAGLPTIALRMPAHPVTQELLRRLDLPLAAPSANRSMGISPTSADHVASTLDGRIAAILDGGTCPRGLESTIVALRKDGAWSLLREGPITREELELFLGCTPVDAGKGVEAPGQMVRHYSPGKPVRLDASVAGEDEFLIGFGEALGHCSLSEQGDLAQAAARLYACLHEAAASPLPRIAVAHIPQEGIGAAICDRLKRAAA